MVIAKDKLKLKIVENNREVLPILVRDIGEDVALVRFDAYADFLIPRNIQADEIQNSNRLEDLIDNQSWILPAVYRGYLTKIFWFKPPWGHQFQDGVYQLQIGKCQQSGQLKVTSNLPYFTSNCIYSSIDQLTNVRKVDVYVSTSGLAKNYSTAIEKTNTPIYDNENESETLDNENRKKTKLSVNETNHKNSQSSSKRAYALDATLLNQLLEGKQFLLDVDVSFFSTDDSIRKQFDENEYELLRYVYTRIVQDHSDAEIVKYMTIRINELDQIRALMNEYLTDPKPDQPIVIENQYLNALVGIIRYKKLDWKPIHNYAVQLSDTRPPLHVSSEGMILYLVESMTRVLESIKKDPVFITISRCVDDGFCSSEQADSIQLHLEKKLRKRYKIEEILGNSLSKSLVIDDDNEDDMNDDDNVDKKSSGKSIELNATNDDKSLHIDTTINNTKTSKNDGDLLKTSSMNLNNQASISPSKSNLSPGEIKPVSPSSLSETSPISN